MVYAGCHTPPGGSGGTVTSPLPDVGSGHMHFLSAVDTT